MSFHKDYKLRSADAPITFDLPGGTLVQNGGDIKIAVSRPQGTVSQRNPQDWSLQVEAVDGGLIDASGQASITFLAPESGYQTNCVLAMVASRQWSDVIQKTFFVKSRGGQNYSKVHLVFGINDTPDGFMYVTLDGVVNTNGSRNWEATAPQAQ